MRKVVVHRPGGYDRLVVEDAPDPVPREGEVLVDVAAAGVNFADCVVRMGLYSSAKEYVGWPITPGFDVAGTTPDGQKVLGVTRFGGYASRVALPRRQVFPLPEKFDLAQGAAFPTVFLTAYYALFEMAKLRPGCHVLVPAAAGGVGGALLQLGRIAGAHLVGVVGSPHKVDEALALGADSVIDRSSEDTWPAAERYAPDGYDVVLDCYGGKTLQRGYEHLAPGGRLVCYGFAGMLPRGAEKPSWLKLGWEYLRMPRFNPLHMTTKNRSVMAFNLSYMFDRLDLLEDSMGRLLGWVNEGKIQPPEVKRYPLDEVAAAHRDLESGQTVGKLVLTL